MYSSFSFFPHFIPSQRKFMFIRTLHLRWHLNSRQVTEKCSWAGGSKIVLQPFLALGCHVWNPEVLACPKVLRKLWGISSKFIWRNAMERDEAWLLRWWSNRSYTGPNNIWMPAKGKARNKEAREGRVWVSTILR